MPTVFKPNDVYAVAQSLANQATGRSDITVTDHQGFIDAGRMTLDAGVDAVTEALFVTVTDVFIKERPYTGKFKLISKNYGPYNDTHANVHFYTKYNEASGAWNTDLFTNLKDGFDNGTNGGASAPDMWVQNGPMPLERFYRMSATYQKRMTIYEEQLKPAFNNETTFLSFVNGYAINIQNELEVYEENLNRAAVADRIAGVYLQVQRGILGPECAVDFTKLFQDETGTTYIRDEIIKEHMTEFLEILMAKLKIDSDRLEEISALYHDAKKKTVDGVDYYILGHTPKAAQRAFFNKEILFKARSRVAPEIFGPQFIPEAQGENVNFWQSNLEGHRYEISCKPALPDGEVSENVNLDMVLGLVFADDAIYTYNQLERTADSPLEAAKLYRNRIWHFKAGRYTDYLENSIIYYMSEYGNLYRKDQFTGDGSETDFELTDAADQILKVTVDGTETTAYTYDSDTKTITFTTAPANKKAVVIEYTVAGN